MLKSLNTPEQKVLLRHIVGMRDDAGMTQRDLAAILRIHHSIVGKVEAGERRLDVVEFCWWCQALGAEPTTAAKTVMAMMVKQRRRFS